MKRAHYSSRIQLWGVAAVFIAAAFLLVSARVGVAEEVSTEPTAPVIDVAQPVDSQQCAPCHLDLSTVNKPGLKFSHGNHLMVSCDGCHSRMPHKAGTTESVPMEVCFACHGIQHGPRGELATSKCEDCHTSSFDLVPKDHQPIKEFAGKPHADVAAKTGVNDCMMCHTASKDCNPCHAEKQVEIEPLPDAYQSMIRDRPRDPSVKIYPTGPTSMSQCVYCHPDLDAIVPGRLIFAHAAHLMRDYDCTACHPKFGHSAKGPSVPDMQSCYRCHGLNHQGQGLVAGDDCYKCHPKDFELMPANHTKKFIKGDHKLLANVDPAYCAMCHKSEFCVDCHQGRSKSPNAPDKPVIPDDHKKATWKTRHGKLYLNQKGACGSCHDQASCNRCHKTPMPHPVGWIENHRPAPGVTTEDCNVCHTDRASCQACHHVKVAKAELIEPNCTPCHPEMKRKPATEIKNKGFAEHAVHFGVAKSKYVKDGKPYTCDDCHIGFSVAAAAASHNAAAGVELPNAGHDINLCYGCHGAVNYQNEMIAPYPGASLCRKCHTDINV